MPGILPPDVLNTPDFGAVPGAVGVEERHERGEPVGNMLGPLLLIDEVGDDRANELQRAVDACQVQAITISD